MNPDNPTLNTIKEVINQVSKHKILAEGLGCDADLIANHDRLISIIYKYEDVVSKNKLSDNYLKQIQGSIAEVQAVVNLWTWGLDLNKIPINQRPKLKSSVEFNNDEILKRISKLEFNFDFFSKLGFFGNNIVAIGANGSGKSTLSMNLKKYLPENGVVISAQRILLIPQFNAILNSKQTSQNLKIVQQADKSSKKTYNADINGSNSYSIINAMSSEFYILLANLMAEQSSIRNQYCNKLREGNEPPSLLMSNLEKALLIWNNLIPHRKLTCEDGVNLSVGGIGVAPYEPYLMSDGEKVMLYLIAQVLQAPQDGFIIVDEPEMYLHKTILKKLWDKLEKQRKDCIFIYLTHDLDFAESRISAKKLWVKSFIYPDKWETEDIPKNEIPERLLLELLGSRKNIIFCEGGNGNHDSKLYNLIFPDYTIMPVSGCRDVINYTKAFNKLTNVTTKAFGVIDSDYHSTDRLQALENENIYALDFAEVENVFLIEDFLEICAKQLYLERSVVEAIKAGIIDAFSKEIELQASNYISSKINYYFNGSHVERGSTILAVEENYNEFITKINIQGWYDARRKELKSLVDSKNYNGIIRIYNNKGTRAIVQKHLKYTEYIELALRLLANDESARTLLKHHMPKFV